MKADSPLRSYSRRVRNVSVVLCAFALAESEVASAQPVNWSHLSSANGQIPTPPPSDGQSGMRVVDLDGDGQTDYLITLWQAPGIVWFRGLGGTFEQYIIEPDNLMLSHGEKFEDIDKDGDIDLIFGQASTGNDIYWWENPHPNYLPTTRWTRRTVRNAGGNMYHDNIWADFDGDGVNEFVSWNQHAKQLLLFEVPSNPKSSGQWPATQIFSWAGTPEVEYRGIAAADINLDGLVDFVGGGGWFEYTGGAFVFNDIDPLMRSARQVAGQLIPGGRPEIVAVQELADGPLNLYQWTGAAWQRRTLIPRVERSHTLELGDVNGDGHVDILFGEMGLATRPPVENPDAVTLILYGNGTGQFTTQTVFVGQGTLEAKLGDIDNDGDLDIVGNTFRHNIPRFDLWINEGPVLPPTTGSVTTAVLGSGTVTKSPNQSSYTIGDVVQLQATPAAGWTFAGWSGAVSGTANPISLTVTGNHTVTATFTSNLPPSSGAPVSDDFGSGILNSNLWTVVNPVGDGSASVVGTALHLSVPAGVDHDVWTNGNRAVRVMQRIADADFEVEVKFDSVVGPKYQLQGILVEQDPGTFLRFNVQGDGTSARMFAASFTSGTPTTRISKLVAAGPRYYLRVAREANLWRFRYSYDGTTWTTIGSFTQALIAQQVGVFGGNAQGITSPAFTAIADYFFNTAAPAPSPPTGSVTTDVLGSGTVTKSPNQSSYTIGDVVQLQATPAAGWTFAGWSGAVSGTANPISLTVTGNHTVTATFTSNLPPSSGAPVSDDFGSGILNSNLWTVVNPVGDGSASVVGTALHLSVPAGVDHDVWTNGNRAVRVMQPIADADFEVEVKFDSVVGPKYQLQGILVEQDPATFLRFNVQGDGTSARMFAASFASGTPTTRISKLVAAGPRYYLRVAREANLWRFRYSYDGTTWTTIGSFTQALIARQVGVFGGNAQGITSPAFTAIADYFFNTASPTVLPFGEMAPGPQHGMGSTHARRPDEGVRAAAEPVPDQRADRPWR